MINYTPPTKHTSLFYNSEEEYLDIVIPYIKAGLENNELCSWIVPKNLRIQDAESYLAQSVENLEGYFRNEQLFIGGYADFYLKDGLFSTHRTIEGILGLEKRALEKGFKGMRGTGDGSWALDKYWFSFLIYEKELNRIIQGHKIRALCSYSLEELDLRNIYNLGINHQSSLVRQMGNWNRISADRFEKADFG